jgi:hypothetical protein
MKSNLSRANHMRVQSNKNIPLTSILKLKDTNSTRMQSELADEPIEPHTG